MKKAYEEHNRVGVLSHWMAFLLFFYGHKYDIIEQMSLLNIGKIRQRGKFYEGQMVKKYRVP